MKFAFYLLGLLILALLAWLFIGRSRPTPNVEYGVSFSRPYAKNDLGLQPDEILDSALNELGIRRFRLAAYWEFLEPKRNEWNFNELDNDIAKISAKGGKVVLALGEKLPRWPECWGPKWWKELPREEQRPLTVKYIETVVNRYRDNHAVIAWQIENEPHFVYGDCPKPELSFLKQEIEHVRKLDPSRPVLTTDSGELSLWVTFGKNVDSLGVSVYRVVKNPRLGTWRYWFLPPYFYSRKAALVRQLGVKNIYVSEFQMEPWSNKPLPETPLEEQLKTFDLKQMQANFRYAERMGLTPIDFWGLEWWYWMKEKHGHPEFWEEAKLRL